MSFSFCNIVRYFISTFFLRYEYTFYTLDINGEIDTNKAEYKLFAPTLSEMYLYVTVVFKRSNQ